MRQRDPQERWALAQVHRGRPEGYLQTKTARGELEVFAGDGAGIEAERPVVERWAAARERYGQAEAVMVCRENARRARLNDLARATLRENGELGAPVDLAGHVWAAGERMIARRNDRDRDLDNGMRGTITSVDEQGAVIRLDSGQTRALDPEYLAAHVEHAFAVTAHGMQGGTVRWAGVIGQPHDFSRNWSYTALSRAQEPVEIFLIDQASRIEQDRAEIAPTQPVEPAPDQLERMGQRMRERDDEDLAVEHLTTTPGTHRHESDQASTPVARDERHHERQQRDARGDEFLSSARPRVYALEPQLHAIHHELANPTIREAQTIKTLEKTIASIEHEHERDRKPAGWRDRTPHRTRKREREQHLSQLHQQRANLRERVADPDQALDRAAQLRERQTAIAAERRTLRDQAIADELAAQPPWLQQTIGDEPNDQHVARRWHKTARELAGHRIDRHITDPHTALDQTSRHHALNNSIAETRSALGLEAPAHAQGAGLER